MSYTKAAMELKMTQPGVSQHIKYLENYYGDKLFCYSNRKLNLTQAGMELKEAMISVKHDTMHLKRKIVDRFAKTNTLKLGATLTIGEFMMPLKIAEYIKKTPDTKIEFTIANTKELLIPLDEGIIDFAIIEGYFQKKEYEYITITNEKYILICGQDYPLKSILDFKELFSHYLILREDGSGTKEILERYLSGRGYSFTDFSGISTIGSIHVIKKLVGNNCGISFLYETAVKRELEEGVIREVKIPEFNIYHEFNFIWRKNSVFRDYYQSLYSSLIMNTPY
jgi:DNA-binding transcriptional LysR family regulator